MLREVLRGVAPWQILYAGVCGLIKSPMLPSYEKFDRGQVFDLFSSV